jgi:diguanylate cyclase (GGDEF)-like protein
MLTYTKEYSPETSRKALTELELALHHHEQWLEAFNATMICRLPPDVRDTADDAHRHCRFGQWYYGHGAESLGRNEGFASVEAEHKRLHQLAAILLRAIEQGDTITLNDYEKFIGALKRMRLEIITLRHDLEDTIYNIDPLTGAAGRVRMLSHLREQHGLVRRHAQSCVIAMMDLDHFKHVNDKYGHLIGDRVLAGCAQYILSNLDSHHKLFRYGGEEFLICLPNSENRPAVDILEHLRQGIAALQFDGNGQGPFSVTASFGLAFLKPELTVEQSLEQADEALYVAKSSGRNRVSVRNDTAIIEGKSCNSHEMHAP